MINNLKDPQKIIKAEQEQINAKYNDNEALKKFWGQRYEETYSHLLDSRNEFGRYGVIAEYLTRVIQKGRVLDVGCGTGILAELIDKDLLIYTGLDISEEAIKIARQKMPEMSSVFHTTRFEEYRPDHTFDALVANEVLYYINTGIFFDQCNRLLKPGGHLIVSIFDFPDGRKLLEELKLKLQSPFEATVTNPRKRLTWNILAGIFKS